MMKKTIIILLCFVMLLSVCSCNQKQQQKTATNYDAVLQSLAETVDGMFAEDFETKVGEEKYPSPTGEHTEKWKAMLLDAKADFHNIDANAFGYKLIDINSDSSPELIFCRTDDRILAVYTIHNGKATLVDAYNRSYSCSLLDTGELYSLTMRDDGGYDNDIATLNHSTGTLYVTVHFGISDNICYETINGTVLTTSNDRITELREQYPFEHGQAFTSYEFNLF